MSDVTAEPTLKVTVEWPGLEPNPHFVVCCAECGAVVACLGRTSTISTIEAAAHEHALTCQQEWDEDEEPA